jgi:hypothetical protein
MMDKQVLKQIKALKFGDRVEVEWLDASEGKSRLRDVKIVSHVNSAGWFLLHKVGHIIIAKEIVNYGEAYHYNVIPVAMIQVLTVTPARGLDSKTKRRLRKFLRLETPRLAEMDGWLFAER